MARSLVFNPFTVTLDWIETTDLSSIRTATPTVLDDDEVFDLGDESQWFQRLPILGGYGSMITGGADSALIGV